MAIRLCNKGYLKRSLVINAVWGKNKPKPLTVGIIIKSKEREKQ